MDGNLNHARPHIHIDYHNQRHIASYAIDDGSRLVGSRIYEDEVREWIIANKEDLNTTWNATRSGPQPEKVIMKLKGSKF